MTHSIQEIAAKISTLPKPMQQAVFDFIDFLQAKVTRQALAIDWNQPEEDGAWMTINDAELKLAKKHRTPPTQLVGQIKELGDVLTSVSADDWGQIKSVSWDEHTRPSKNNIPVLDFTPSSNLRAKND